MTRGLVNIVWYKGRVASVNDLLQTYKKFQNPKAAKISRRFLIVEGIYLNGGDLCKIEDFVPLKHKYRLRYEI